MTALGVLEFESVAVGIRAGDAMVKSAPVASITAGTIHPGRYLVLVNGDVASVDEALGAGRSAAAGAVIDEVFLPDPHGDVVAAVGGHRASPSGEALGILETATVAATLAAADAAVKAAAVTLIEVHLGDDLGGKSYLLLSGPVSDVDAAVAAGQGAIASSRLLHAVVVPMLAAEMGDNLWSAARFVDRIGESDAAG
jgi:microcompartment protein CcmL/EutN